MASAEIDFEQKAIRLGTLFTPATPIDAAELFCGRTNLIRQVIDAINQTGRHAILYGERGVGKTSLANILATRLTAKGESVTLLSPHVNCDSGDDFNKLWRKVFAEIRIARERRAVGFANQMSQDVSLLTDQISDADITPDAVNRVLRDIGSPSLLYVILDEFDKLPDTSVRTLIADTIKLLSDRATPATVILVGVADDVTGLIYDHQSVERCLEQVHMNRMSRIELEQIVEKGLAQANMTIERPALNEITGLSKGLPHYTHLLSLHAGRRALDSQSLIVSEQHVKAAINVAIRGAQETIRTMYDKATYSTKKNAIYTQVLTACAMAQTDEFGNFWPTGVADPLSKIMKKVYSTESFGKHLHTFCSAERGPVLRKTGSEYKWRYRFVNPLMQPYVLMKGLSAGIITENDLRLDRDHDGQRRITYGESPQPQA
jgi:Cdc6-like AAA superfamily ATPase